MAKDITEPSERVIYQDKKRAKIDPDLIRKHLIQASKLHHEMIESVEEAKHRYQLYQALNEQGGLSK
jgi:hypothetical protein